MVGAGRSRSVERRAELKFFLGSTRDNAHRDGMGRRGRDVVCAKPDGVDRSERDQKVLKVR